ncbi:MAG: glycosyltransferase [Solirubrobacterales bacterium]
MRVCLIAPAPNDAGAPAHSLRALAALLSRRHEVTLIHSGWGEERPDVASMAEVREAYAELPEELAPLKFACPDHRHSAAVMETIRRLYADAPPDYLEVPGFRAHGLVSLQARRGADSLLAGTTIAVRISPTSELLNLQNGMLRQPGNQRLAQLEREQLRLADRLLWPGGDCLDLYRRYYSDLKLPADARIRPPLDRALEVAPANPAPVASDQPLRLLYLRDLDRAGGILDLVEACWTLPPQSWHLTVVGADTLTAGMGLSVRETIELMSAEDPRIEFVGPLATAELRERLADVDLMVAPSRLETLAIGALEAMAAGVPVLATPVGDLLEAVEDGVSGWLTAGIGRLAIGEALRRLEADRGELERVRSSGEPARRAAALTDSEAILDAYDDLLDARRPAPPPPAVPLPLVTGIVPYYSTPEYVGEAVASLLAQTHAELEVLIVNDGSFEPADSVLDALAADPRVRVVTQINRGEGPARTLGVRLARGEFVVMLDADNLLEPNFVERALETMLRNPELGYATCWLRMVGPDGEDTDLHPGFAPLGNSVLTDDSENWDGDTLALLRRSVFTELGFEYHPEGSMHSDWELYRWMRDRGVHGTVIPERLARYRVLGSSLMRSYAMELQDRSWDESRERIRVHGVRWTPEAAG